jgi:hypothetical protein
MPLSGSFTTATQNQILDTLAGNNIIDGPLDGLELGLFHSDPGEAGSLTDELQAGSGNSPGYARTKFSVDMASTVSGVGEITNTAQIDFPVASGAWSNIGYAAVFQGKSYTRSIVGRTNSGQFDSSGNAQSYTRLMIPASYCGVLHTATITSQAMEQPDEQISTSGYHWNVTYDGTNSTLFAQDINNNATNFVRVISGPLSGVCFDLVGEGTNTLLLDAPYVVPEEDIIGSKIQVLGKVTLASLSGIVHNDCASFDSTTQLSPSGIYGAANSGDGDRVYIHEQNQTMAVMTAMYDTFGFSGGCGWRKTGAASTADAGGCVINPMEIMNHFDQIDDDFANLMTKQDADWTLTSQHWNAIGQKLNSPMRARLQFEDSSGTATPISVTSGQQLSIAAGDLKITLD